MKSQGQTLTEYSLIGLCVIGLTIPALVLLSGAMKGQVSGLLSPPDTGSIQAAATGSLKTDPNKSATGTNHPAGPHSAINIPASLYTDLSRSVQTAGANGATKVLANRIATISQEQLAAGKIDQAQFNALMALANQGHHIAQIEKLIETAAAETPQGGDAFRDKMITFDGKQLAIYDLYGDIGFKQDYSEGLLTNPFDTQIESGPEMKQFIALYNQAKASGALNNPAISDELGQLAMQIASIADSMGFAGQDISKNILSTSEIKQDIATRLAEFDASGRTNRNSSQICGLGNGEDSGTNCQ